VSQWAFIVSSGRLVEVKRRGRVLLVYGAGRANPFGERAVSVCRYDERFHLLPKGWSPHP
jgi:hypothetical protein